MSMPSTLGTTLKDARLQKKWSIRHLHRESNVAVRTIRAIEAGDQVPYDHTLAKLAEALGLDLDALVASLEEQAS